MLYCVGSLADAAQNANRSGEAFARLQHAVNDSSRCPTSQSERTDGHIGRFDRFAPRLGTTAICVRRETAALSSVGEASHRTPTVRAPINAPMLDGVMDALGQMCCP